MRTAAIPLAATLLCAFFFGIYGWFEFTGRSYDLWRFAKHWSGMGAETTADNIGRIASAKHLWEDAYRELPQEEVQSRFSLQETSPKIKLWFPEYLKNILLSRILNELERRYSNQRFRAFIIDTTGYVPTGKDRNIGGESLWDWYTGDETKDSLNFSHRFFPIIENIDKILNTIYEKDNIGYVGSQIVINQRVWGYFIVSFDIRDLRLIRDEIIRRIIIVSMFIGITLSLLAKKLWI